MSSNRRCHLLFPAYALLPIRSGLLPAPLILFFCTSAWSTAGRSLWPHGPTMLVLCLALYLLLLSEKKPRLTPLIALPLAFSFIVRPSNAVFIVVFSAYILLKRPRQFPLYALVGLLTAAPWFFYNLSLYGNWLPLYYAPSRFAGSSDILVHVLGHLVSPERGVLIYTPLFLFCAYGIYLKIRTKHFTWIDGVIAASICGHVAMISVISF